jgi:hypothetical protein
MKKTILPIVLCMAIVSSGAHAADRSLSDGGVRSKKSASVSRNILSDKLPARLLTTIKKDYKSYWITGLYKEDASGKISYHITIENADQIVTLTANHAGNWSVVRVVPRDPANS